MVAYEYKSKNSEIIDYEKPITKRIIQTCKNSYKINKSFFETDIPFFRLIICHSEDIFKKETASWYNPSLKGRIFPRQNKIVMRGPKEVLECYKKYKGAKSFNTIMAHEMAHLFEEKFLGKRHNPLWLSEGLASLAGLNGKKPKIKKDKIMKSVSKNLFFYRRSKKILDQNYKIIYPLYYFFVECIVQKYGRDKLLRLLKSLPEEKTEPNFKKTFKRIYLKTEGDMINEFLERSI